MGRQLIINNRVISEEPMKILELLRAQLTNGKLSQFRYSGGNIQVTCPFHSNGLESHPSAFINLSNDDIPYLWFHCFVDNESCSFAKFVGACFDKSESFGVNWLLQNFATDFIEESLVLPKIVLGEQKLIQPQLKESILDEFEAYHPYMTARKISDDIIKKFDIKYDRKTDCIVFPVRDRFGRLAFLTRRSVTGKKFIIDKGIKKEIYLLYNILRCKAKEVYICESQINALVCESYGKSAIATIGCGCPDYQIQELNQTDVLHYIIAFDPDQAGLKGTLRLCDNLSKNKFISIMILPKGKDVGDLTKDEFDKCPIVTKDEFMKNIPDYYCI